jgi:uncharacterized protein (DUF849 family)
VPRSPEELAADAVAVTEAGAEEIHVHPRGPDGAETLGVDAAVGAIRRAVAVPVGVTTGAWIPGDRVAAVRSWTALPDYASVNLSEEGWADVARALRGRGIGMEAGVWTVADAERLVASGLLGECLRILVEPRERGPEAALSTVAAIEAVLGAGGPPLLVHGYGATAWPVLRYAQHRGLDTRIGLEDVLVLPDGSPAADNAALVVAATAAP